MTEPDGQRASNQLAAETFIPMMMEAFHDGLGEIGSLSRWLLATLVATNGAAAISLLPLKMEAAVKVGGAGAFLLGILAALGAGFWSLYAFKRVSIGARTMLGYWLTVAGDGPRIAAAEAAMKRHMEQAIGSRSTHLLLGLSAAAFLVGCVFTGWGMLSRGGTLA